MSKIRTRLYQRRCRLLTIHLAMPKSIYHASLFCVTWRVETHQISGWHWKPTLPHVSTQKAHISKQFLITWSIIIDEPGRILHNEFDVRVLEETNRNITHIHEISSSWLTQRHSVMCEITSNSNRLSEVNWWGSRIEEAHKLDKHRIRENWDPHVS